VFSAQIAQNAFNANNAFSAQSADSATSAGNSDRVDGLPARTFSWDVAEGSAGKTLLNLEGLFMRTSACPTGDASQSFDIFASTVINNSCVRFHPSAQPDHDDDFDTIDGDQPVKAGSDGSASSTTAASAGWSPSS
jgi:hypothetical protein